MDMLCYLTAFTLMTLELDVLLNNSLKATKD